jgi:hypothetical protein
MLLPRNRAEDESRCIMPDFGGSIEWDFLTLAAWWNLCGLPLCLAAVAVTVVVRNRWTGGITPAVDGARAVAFIGCIHFTLALRGLIQLVQELLTLRVMGIPQSFPIVGLVAPALAVVVDPLLGLGLLRRRPVARWCAIAWYALWSALTIYVGYWMWRHSVRVDPASWPDQVVSKGLTMYLLVVVFVPRVRHVFVTKRLLAATRNDTGASASAAPASRPAWPAVSLPTFLVLIIVLSTVVVDATDWAIRLATEPGSIP